MWSSQLQLFRTETKLTWRSTWPTPTKSLLGSLARTYLSVLKSIKTVFLESTSVTLAKLELFPASEFQTTALVSNGASSSHRIWMVETTTWQRQLTVSSWHSSRSQVRILSKFQFSSAHSESLNPLMEQTLLKLTTKTRFSTSRDQLKLTSQSRWASTLTPSTCMVFLSALQSSSSTTLKLRDPTDFGTKICLTTHGETPHHYTGRFHI